MHLKYDIIKNQSCTTTLATFCKTSTVTHQGHHGAREELSALLGSDSGLCTFSVSFHKKSATI